MSGYNNNPQPDPRYFDIGSSFLGGMQQAQDNTRRNELVDIERQQQQFMEQRYADALRQQQEQSFQQSQQAQADVQRKAKILSEILPDQFKPMAGELAAGLDDNDIAKMIQDQSTPEQPKLITDHRGMRVPDVEGVRERDPRVAAQDPAPSYAEVIDPKDPSRLLKIDGRSYRGGSLGDPGVIGIAGKEPGAAKRQEKTETGKEGVSDLVATIRDAYNQLNQGGGIVDPAKGAWENLGAAASSSAIGQVVGGKVGTNNQSLRNQIKAQRPLLLQAIKNATGMTAQQMNSDRDIQLWLAAATDPDNADYKANTEALDNIDRLYGLGGGADASVAPSGPGRAPSGTVIDFSALPP